MDKLLAICQSTIDESALFREFSSRVIQASIIIGLRKLYEHIKGA